MSLVWADLDREVVTVHGDDAASFLHSQLAQDIASMNVGESRHSFLLEPTGHITTLLRVVRHSETMFTLDTDAGHGQAIIDRLKRFILRSKVELAVSDWRVRAFRGENVVAEIGEVKGRALVAHGGTDAIDVIAPLNELPVFGEATEQGYIDMLRVDAGWPHMGIDILVGDIPATSGVVQECVSFTKGCYPGQELVERMDSRGANAPVVVRSLPRDGVGVGMRLEENGKFVGTVTSIGFTRALARVDRSSTIGEPLI